MALSVDHRPHATPAVDARDVTYSQAHLVAPRVLAFLHQDAPTRDWHSAHPDRIIVHPNLVGSKEAPHEQDRPYGLWVQVRFPLGPVGEARAKAIGDRIERKLATPEGVAATGGITCEVWLMSGPGFV